MRICNLIFTYLMLAFSVVAPVRADSPETQSTLSKIAAAPDPALLLNSLAPAIEGSDRALKIYLVRKISRNYPFSITAAGLLDSVRKSDVVELKSIEGNESWLIPLPFLRLLVLLVFFITAIGFELKSFRTFLFSFLLVLMLFGEYLNFVRELDRAVLIPFEGEHFALSAPDLTSQAVEKLQPGAEIAVSEFGDEWIKINLASGRSGWVSVKDGIIEAEAL